MITFKLLQEAVQGISAVELIPYFSRLANPRQVAIERKYSTYRIYSLELTNTGKHKSVSFHEDDCLTIEAIQAKVIALVDSAIRDFEAEQAREEQRKIDRAKEYAQKADSEAQWIAKLRFAKSGQTDKPLEGTENQFRAFSTNQLMEAGKGFCGIQVALPIDLTKRAEFLAKLDSFLHTL